MKIKRREFDRQGKCLICGNSFRSDLCKHSVVDIERWIERDYLRRVLAGKKSAMDTKFHQDADCVFCKIIAGVAPATIIHKWPFGLAFVPLNPVCPGHILVVPTQHVANAAENPMVTALTAQYAAEYAASLRTDFNIITSAGKAATQSVFHLHIHVVPRKTGDGLLLPWSNKE